MCDFSDRGSFCNHNLYIYMYTGVCFFRLKNTARWVMALRAMITKHNMLYFCEKKPFLHTYFADRTCNLLRIPFIAWQMNRSSRFSSSPIKSHRQQSYAPRHTLLCEFFLCTYILYQCHTQIPLVGFRYSRYLRYLKATKFHPNCIFNFQKIRPFQ